MRKRLLVITFIISLFSISTIAQKTGIITINTTYTGVVDGYDHMNKTMIYVDGLLAGETSEQVQSKPNSCTVSVTRGKHNIRVINMANYDGNWEEHTITNNYSIDALYESEIKLKKDLTITLVFDITQEKTFARVE